MGSHGEPSSVCVCVCVSGSLYVCVCFLTSVLTQECVVADGARLGEGVELVEPLPGDVELQ